MAITNLQRTIWAAQILETFRNQAIWAGIVNRDYEGEAAQGNKVHIPGVVDVTVTDYKAAGRTTSPEDLSDTGVDLLIDQEKSFDFVVDDIDKAQSNPGSFDAYSRSAANGLVQDSDSFLASLAVTGGTALASTAAPTTGDEAFDLIADLRQALTNASAPASDRILVVNGDFDRFLVGASSKLTDADRSGSTEGLREASLGRILGFDTYVSNNLPGTTPQAVAFHKSALAYASTISEFEGMRAENKFADRLRGLHVYGAKVLRPTAIQVFTAI